VQAVLHASPTADAGTRSTLQVDHGAVRGYDRDHDWTVTIRLLLDAPEPVVFVAGALDRRGGALLTAVLEYVQQQHGGSVAVDLAQVSQIDRHGLASVIESGAMVASAPPRIRRVLTGSVRSARGTGRPEKRASASGCRDPATSRRPGAHGPEI